MTLALPLPKRPRPAERPPAPSRRPFGGGVLAALLLVADCVVIFDAFALAYLLRFHFQVALWHADPAPVDEYLKALVAVAYSWLLLFKAFGLYDLSRRRSALDTVLLVAKAVSVGTLILLSMTFFYRQFTFSRLVCAYAWGLAIILFSALRLTLDHARDRRRRQGLDLVDTAVIGSGSIAGFLIERIAREPELGYRVVGVIGDDLASGDVPAPLLGPLSDLDELIERHQLAGILIAHPGLGHFELLRAIEVCELRRLALRMVPPTYDLMVNYRDFEEVDGMPLMRINEQEYRQLGDLMKRAFDVAVSAAALVVLSPALAAAALAIRSEDGGPVLFVQRRVGKDGRPFDMVKLRTMVVGAEALLPSLVDVDALGEPVFKLEADPRITRIGRLLRRTSLDELPQLWNVLRGEMSLVGPRPEEAGLVDRYNVWERRRLKAIPGLTGLQQVQCRGSTSLKERVRWDILYLRKRCILLDLWILLKTGWVVLHGKGAR